MSFTAHLSEFVEKQSTLDTRIKRSVQEIKSDPLLQNLSKYIRGGISKLTKSDLMNFIECLMQYNTVIRSITPDEEQQKIIEEKSNVNIRIIAGAGSGKTQTLVLRIRHLMTLTTPNKILVLTFNVEACKNLERMIDKIMGFKIKIEIRTIDSFCYKIINDFNNSNNNRFNVTTYSLNESTTMGKNIMKKYGREIASQYEYVFFDEFQDVDKNQYEILKSFSTHGSLITVVGDDSQNIYQFRGSDNYYIINFDKDFTNTVTHKITTNYRSNHLIVNLANQSISHNCDKIVKTMRASDNLMNGVVDLTICCKKDHIISHVINAIHAKQSWGDIAVLSRNTYMLKILETEFEKHAIPYVALISDQSSNDGKQTIQENCVVLSTIHRAKGLEWTTVYIIGISDYHFPNHLNNGLANIEEERRLFYVGVTRAKKNLHFVAMKKDLPLSRFVEEIKEHITVHNKLKKKQNLFDIGTDDAKIKKSYTVNEIVTMLKSQDIECLRKYNLLPSIIPHTQNVFSEKISLSENIKKNSFESDYSIYCDCYLNRELMIRCDQKIYDMYADNILIHRTDTGYYPPPILGKMLSAYRDYCDSTKSSATIMRSIYYVSLCRKFNSHRRRLVYRDIYELFNEYSLSIIPRIDQMIGMICGSGDRLMTKINLIKNYTMNHTTISLFGEIKFINIDRMTLIHTMYSESDYRLEWMIQLLIIYSMYVDQNNSTIDIRSFVIVNVFNGTIYSFDIPTNYCTTQLLDVVGGMIENSTSGVRNNRLDSMQSNINIDLLVDSSTDTDTTTPTDIPDTMIELKEPADKSGYMVLDVENNCMNQDIIQIAYIIYSDDNKEIKRVNRYVKDRFVDQRACEITRITTDILRTRGIPFIQIIKELFSDAIALKSVCGHNLHTDITKIKNNMVKYHIKSNIDVFRILPINDTMIMYRDTYGKKISLSAMYNQLMGRPMQGAHDAMVDVESTAQCFIQLNKKKHSDSWNGLSALIDDVF